MSEHPALLTARELRRGLDEMVGSSSKSYSCLSKRTTTLVDSLARHGDFDHTRPSTRKSAMLRDIAEWAGLEYDTDDWRSPRALTKGELVAVYEAVEEALDDG